MINQNSLSAYFDESNQRTFNSHRAMIVRELKANPFQHSYQLAKKLGLTNEAVKKRLSDLTEFDIIETNGSVYVHKNLCAIYNIKEMQPLFPVKKLTLRQWLKSNHPNIFNEYETLIEKKL